MVLKECGQAEYRTMFQAGNLGGIIGSDAARDVPKGGPFSTAQRRPAMAHRILDGPKCGFFERRPHQRMRHPAAAKIIVRWMAATGRISSDARSPLTSNINFERKWCRRRDLNPRPPAYEWEANPHQAASIRIVR
jgi:hypothetical protein